ncbi:hypothetical protein NV75_08360 (plasmid) [Oenococcus kitaharae]|nr:hypothetical protein NV75_08360 [Oenococcus kitaharae]
MNKVSFRQLTASEYDTLFAIVSQIKDQGARELTLSFDQIKSLIRWDKSQREELFVKTLINMYDKIINLKFNRTSDDGNIISRFVVFSRYSINKEKQTALIAVSADFWQLFNLLFDNFTTFMLDDLVYISTSYGKELFRNIKQFRTQGYLYWSIEIFRQKLMVPDSFSTGKAFQRVFGKRTLKQLQTAIPGFTYKKKTSRKRGNPVIGIEFSWNAEKFNEDYLKRNTSKKDFVQLELLNQTAEKQKSAKKKLSERTIPLTKIGKNDEPLLR